MLERVNGEMRKQLVCYKEELDELKIYNMINKKTEVQNKTKSVKAEFKSLTQHYERHQAINSILKDYLEQSHKRERELQAALSATKDYSSKAKQLD